MRPTAALLLSVCCAALLHADCDRSPLLVRNAYVWTGTRFESARDVLFRDGRVATTGRVKDVPAGTRLIDASGDTLLPGLIDLHLHFVIPGMPGTARTFAISGRQMLRYGVTTGRLHLASLEQAAELRRIGLDDCAAMPGIQAGGPGIGGGAPALEASSFTGVRSPEDARAKVERIAGAALQWLPVHSIDKFSDAERTAIFEAARARRLRVFAEALNPPALREALRWPIDTLDYIDRTEAAGYPPDLLKTLRARRRSLAAVPAVGIFEWYKSLRNGSASLDREYLYEFLDPADAERVRSRAKHDLANDSYVAASAKFAATLRRKLHDLIATGVPVALGTDVGSPVQLHPGAIWREMEAWRSYGVAPQAVLRAATSIPAAILGEREIGHLEPGARADFVMYRGRITEGKFDAARVRAVARGGVLYVAEREWIFEPRK